jgi:hypothetical protein
MMRHADVTTMNVYGKGMMDSNLDAHKNFSYMQVWGLVGLRPTGNRRNLLIVLVGAEGFEPPTLCSQSRCATRLRYAPTKARQKTRLSDCIAAGPSSKPGVVAPKRHPTNGLRVLPHSFEERAERALLSINQSLLKVRSAFIVQWEAYSSI